MIYKNTCFFKFLYVVGEDTLIYYLPEEPVKWSDVNIILKRDTTYHGLNYQFTDSDIQLEFAKDCGLEIIEQVYGNDGQDGDIVLQFGFIISGVEQVEYQGKLNLNTYKKQNGRVSCTIENSSFIEAINTNNEISIDLFDTETLNGEEKTSTAIDLTLHSKKLLRYTIVKSDDISEAELLYTGKIFFTFDLTNTSTDDISDYLTTGFSVLSEDPTSELIDVPIFEMAETGEYELYFYPIFYASYACRILIDAPGDSYFHLNIKVVVKDSDGNTKIDDNVYSFQEIINPNELDSLRHLWKYKEVSLELTQSLTLEVGDKVYLYGEAYADYSVSNYLKIEMQYTDEITVLKMSALTEQVESNAKGILIYESLRAAVWSMTDKDAFYSEYFGRTDLGYSLDGDGALKVITNGYFIRNFEITDRELTTTFKTFLESIRAIFGIGLGIEQDEESKELVRIEPISYFYGQSLILSIEHVADYYEETAKDLIYNQVKIGYSKYPDEGEYVLDEFNTQLEFSTPIKTNKNELQLLSSIIASGFAIEETRRVQFEDDPDDSTTYDEDLFIISVVRSDGAWKSEKLENYSLQNVLSSDTAYNVAITPKRNLLRFGKWINSGLTYKKGTDLIRNTSFTYNGEAQSKSSTESVYLKENANIALNDFDSRQQLFKPMFINFKCRLSFSQVSLLRNAHMIKGHELKNGYLSVKNREGVWKNGYLWEMTYNPSKQEATIKLLEKANSENGTTCQDYADYTFGDFEEGSTPLWIEDCSFANFR